MTTSDQIALLGAAAGAILGLLAIWISLRANRISAAAERLARTAYFSERRIAVASSSAKDERGNDCLLLAPAGSDQSINNMTLFFPQKIGILPIVLTSGDLRLFHQRIAPKLRAYWDSRTPPRSGYSLVRSSVPIPVAALIHGHTKGDAVITLGMYDLYCRYARHDNGTSSIEVISLTLNNWSLPGANPQQEANRLLAAQESVDAASNPTLQPTAGSPGQVVE